jgi:hypothetical protein
MLIRFKDRTRRLLAHLGLTDPPLHFASPLPFWCPQMARAHRAIDRRVRPFTMTSAERVAALCQAIAYLERAAIQGAVVECGVWRGGSMMAAALALLRLGSTTRPLYLFDTFQGMTPPAEIDRDWRGQSARALLEGPSSTAQHFRACCSLYETRDALAQTGYPWEKLIFIAGRVEDTLPREAPERIALLRLDTDWYESTYHELETLYPRLADGGVVLIDDYGYWQGARQAVDDYFARRGEAVELHPIDFTGRLLIKRVRESQGPHWLTRKRALVSSS